MFDKIIGIKIQGYILDLAAEEFEEVLDKLELTVDGTTFMSVYRLYRQLGGDCTAADSVAIAIAQKVM